TNHNLQLRAGGNVTKMLITSDGRVGINTTTPGGDFSGQMVRLEVNGAIRLNSALFTAGDMTLYGGGTAILAHASGVVVTTSWGGNGHLGVDGNLGVGGQFTISGNQTLLMKLHDKIWFSDQGTPGAISVLNGNDTRVFGTMFGIFSNPSSIEFK